MFSKTLRKIAHTVGGAVLTSTQNLCFGLQIEKLYYSKLGCEGYFTKMFSKGPPSVKIIILSTPAKEYIGAAIYCFKLTSTDSHGTTKVCFVW